MAVDVVMPQMGGSIFEGTITKWLKKPGDKVERDEPLFEISTDKVDAEIPSPSAGVLQEIKIAEGQTVPIQTVVAVIDGAGSAAAAPAPTPRNPPLQPRHRSRQNPPPAAPAPAATPLAASTASAPASSTVVTTDAASSERVHSSPLVRRLPKNMELILAHSTGQVRADVLPSRTLRRHCRSVHLNCSPIRRLTGRWRRFACGRNRTSSRFGAATCSGSVGSSRYIRCAWQPVRSRIADRCSARTVVFWRLRSSADERHAAENCRTHGCFKARFAARLFSG